MKIVEFKKVNLPESLNDSLISINLEQVSQFSPSSISDNCTDVSINGKTFVLKISYNEFKDIFFGEFEKPYKKSDMGPR